jgi:drug/metabolite transporter, DME family
VRRADRTVLAVLTSGLLLGTTGTAAALGPAGASPIALGVIRLQLGGLLIAALLPVLGGEPRNLPRLWRRPRVLVMALSLGLYQPLFLAAVSQAGVALGTLVAVGVAPVWTGLVGWIALRDRPSPRWMAATGIAVTGLVLRSWGNIGEADLLGIALALLAGLLTAAYAVAGKVELARGTAPIELPAAASVLGGIVLAPLLLTTRLDWVPTPPGVALLLWLGVFTMAAANILHIIGLREMRPGRVATLMLSGPLTATVSGVLLLGEGLSPASSAGVLLVLAGIAMQGRETEVDEATELESAPAM